jgi:hypothetical protein
MTNELHDTGTVEVWAETVRLRVLAEPDPEPRAATETPPPAFDPYNTDIAALEAGPRPRRSLDDMRRLSEAIVRNRLKTTGNA